jgi:hypothetical protein
MLASLDFPIGSCCFSPAVRVDELISPSILWFGLIIGSAISSMSLTLIAGIGQLSGTKEAFYYDATSVIIRPDTFRYKSILK